MGRRLKGGADREPPGVRPTGPRCAPGGGRPLLECPDGAGLSCVQDAAAGLSEISAPSAPIRRLGAGRFFSREGAKSAKSAERFLCRGRRRGAAMSGRAGVDPLAESLRLRVFA